MGKASKIKDLSKANVEFNSYMDELEKEMGEYAKKYQTEFLAEVNNFYADDKTRVQIEGKSHRDYQIEIEFSMKNIKEIIENTTSEIFLSSSGGEEKEEQKIMSALESYKDMAAKIAVSFLTNVLSSLRFSQSSSYKYDIQHVSVGPGLTLHMLVVEKYYDGKGFFEKKRIIQNFIEYKLIFSKTVAAAEMDIEYITNQMREYSEYSETYLQLKKEYKALITSEEYVKEKAGGERRELAANYKEILADLKDSREEAYQAVKSLCGTQNLLRARTIEMGKEACDEKAVDRKRMAKVNAPLRRYLGEV
ncbi:hypothetical protein [Luxibacter massiliensis]|uniref:hypothetical protein n=1 Tax=Luxibacter massiliensis TaxID=2219695 RepID=UPI000F04ACE6|nr:hypothetical protein [Luxibacter massiliensis]